MERGNNGKRSHKETESVAERDRPKSKPKTSAVAVDSLFDDLKVKSKQKMKASKLQKGRKETESVAERDGPKSKPKTSAVAIDSLFDDLKVKSKEKVKSSKLQKREEKSKANLERAAAHEESDEDSRGGGAQERKRGKDSKYDAAAHKFASVSTRLFLHLANVSIKKKFAGASLHERGTPGLQILPHRNEAERWRFTILPFRLQLLLLIVDFARPPAAAHAAAGAAISPP